MKKEFQQWANEKEKLEKKDSRKICCKKREIWIAKIGVNIGQESSKDSPFFRPALVLETKLGGNDLILIAPLTSQYDEKLEKFLLPISHKKLNKKSFAQLHQIKVISKKRLNRNLEMKISVDQMDAIKKRLQEQVLKPQLSEQAHSNMKRFSKENLD